MIEQINKKELIRLANEARFKAYAKYSGLAVGSAIQTSNNLFFTGCNIENASYGLTICAERVALAEAVKTLGFSTLQNTIVALAIVTETPQPIVPCGACLQVLSELQTDFTIFCGTPEGLVNSYQLSELLPKAFRL